MLQLPQVAASFRLVSHPAGAAQSAKPTWQASTAQAPFSHRALAFSSAQGLHVPQPNAGSDAFTHWPAHSTWPAAHPPASDPAVPPESKSLPLHAAGSEPASKTAIRARKYREFTRPGPMRRNIACGIIRANYARRPRLIPAKCSARGES